MKVDCIYSEIAKYELSAADLASLCNDKLMQAIKELELVTQHTLIDEHDEYKALVKYIAWLETCVAQYRALKSQFDSVNGTEGDIQLVNRLESGLFQVPACHRAI